MISCLDIHVHITEQVHLLAEVVVPSSCGDAGFLTKGYSWQCVSLSSGCPPDEKNAFLLSNEYTSI